VSVEHILTQMLLEIRLKVNAVRGQTRWVEHAYSDLHAASAKVSISQLQVQQSTEAVAIARTRYETGSITNLDLLDAETAQSAARLGNLQAQYRLVLSKYDVERAIGGKPME
jgi:outer membrane protein TolC